MKYNNNNNTLSNKLVLYSNKVKLKPFIAYSNALLSRPNALKDNRGKSGIYRWTNLITDESYVGSSKDLTERFRNYYNKKDLNRRLLKGNSRIYTALLKYDYENFSLEILEYCDIYFIIEREQYYIDLLKPEYNIQSIASRVLFLGHSTTIVNKKDNSTKVYDSIRAAARDIGVNYSTLYRYINKDKLLKGTYLVTKM
jgi:GIY-YIG catalytic domain/NUMOD1 domain